jgi:hypothetical protein
VREFWHPFQGAFPFTSQTRGDALKPLRGKSDTLLRTPLTRRVPRPASGRGNRCAWCHSSYLGPYVTGGSLTKLK